MSQIYDSLKSLVTPDMITKASSFLGESESKVSSAVSSIIPGFLGSILKKGDTPQLKSTLEDAGRSSIMSDLGSIFAGNATAQQQSIGDKFLNAVMGGKSGDFISAVSSQTGITNSSANKLTTILSAMTAAFLGNKVVNNNLSVSSLLSDIASEKGKFMNMIPSKFNNSLGLSSNNTTNRKQERVENIPVKGKKNNSWITWLVLILLLLLLFFWWRSCKRNGRADYVADRDRTEVVDTVDRNRINNDRVDTDRAIRDIELPDGKTIRVYRGGIEDDMLTFLRSDRYRDASADDLRDRWFHFDDIEFRHDSATEFMDSPERQLDNLASIFKAYPDAKIRIAGYADKTGTEAINQEISEQRANTIKTMLVNRGINASRIVTEGFGEEYAKVPETASDEKRAEDRQIAVRFVK